MFCFLNSDDDDDDDDVDDVAYVFDDEADETASEPPDDATESPSDIEAMLHSILSREEQEQAVPKRAPRPLAEPKYGAGWERHRADDDADDDDLESLILHLES